MVVKIYTDGACSGNPGPGGWGFIILYGDKKYKGCGYKEDATNNRMELMAVIESIDFVLKMVYQDMMCIDVLEIISDSAYVVNAIKKNWIKKWNENNFKNHYGEDVKNRDLWMLLLGQMDIIEFLGIKLKMVKVKGHNGNLYNEQVDRLARSAIMMNTERW